MTGKSEIADALDKHIGDLIRRQRENLGLTQAELARASGVSYQQIHKYERGTNRVSAGRLGLIAAALQMTMAQFYDGFAVPPAVVTGAHAGSEGRLCLEVARNFRQIGNLRHQKALNLLVRVLAG